MNRIAKKNTFPQTNQRLGLQIRNFFSERRLQKLEIEANDSQNITNPAIQAEFYKVN